MRPAAPEQPNGHGLQRALLRLANTVYSLLLLAHLEHVWEQK
jgi:hypothetical protein